MPSQRDDENGDMPPAQPPIRYAPTLVLGLLGAVALTVGVSKPWLTATAKQSSLPTLHAEVTGADLAPIAGALGFVVLAAFGAVIATRGWVRRALGVLIVVAAAVVLVAAIDPPGGTDSLRDGLTAKGWTSGSFDTATTWWRWLTIVGAIVCILAGLAVAAYGGRWATMGSTYDAPHPRPAADVVPPAEDLSEAELWREIDQGRDPTRRRES